MTDQKYQIKELSRSKILKMARLECLCHIMGNLPLGEESLSPFTWNGSFESGEYQYSDGLGNNLAIKWNEKELVLLIYDHESSRSHYVDKSDPEWVSKDDNKIPSFFSKNFPPSLKTLLLEANLRLAKVSDPNVTCLLWAEEDIVYVPESFDSAIKHGLWMVENYLLDYEEAVIEGNDKSQPWFEIYSLSAEQQDLVVWLASQLETSSGVKLTKAQWQDFLTLDSSWADYKTGLLTPITEQLITATKNKLKSFNITVPN